MNKNATLSEVREAVAFVTEIQESVQQMHFQLHQVEEKQTNEILLVGYINPINKFQIKLLSKGGRKIYLSNQNLKTDIFCFFILTNNIEKSYLNSFEKETKLSGELVAKIFI